VKRIAMSVRAFRLLATVPNVPEFDDIQTDGVATVITFNDDADALKFNAACAAAAENREYLLQLARASVGSDSLEAKVERWAQWLRNGQIGLGTN
jgi:hypothetical protein